MATLSDAPSFLRLVILGAGATGKSALTIRLVANQWRNEYDPTIEDNYTKILNIDGRSFPLDILDTGGQEQFSALQDHWIREGQIFLLVYAINDKSTFQNTEALYNKIVRNKGDVKTYSVILVGNKSDLSEILREVSIDEGQLLANNIDAAFYETSARTGYNVVESFEEGVVRYMNLDQAFMAPTLKDDLRKRCKCNCQCNCIWLQMICSKKKTLLTSTAQDHPHKVRKIKFFHVNKLPPDEIRTPVLALKNFKIRRKFHFRTMILSVICGLLLPVVIVVQTILFLGYNECTHGLYSKIYPKLYPYDDVHASLPLDYLGIVVGRKPGQDPECVKDAQWFLMQNPAQLLQRIIITICICIGFIICCYNIFQVRNDALNVSLMETVGPFLLFWILWSLLSVWIGYELRLSPQLPSMSRLRSIWLFFGEEFSNQSSAYKFLRAYSRCRGNIWRISISRKLMVLALGLLYACVPGITRATVGDSSDHLHKKLFFTINGFGVQFGALFANFLLITSFIYAIEVQYSKHFDNYREFMTDLTMLLNKENYDTDDQMQGLQRLSTMSPNLRGRVGSHFGKQLFLSLTRRSNGLGWLEIRAFLAVEGKILFGEQELPTLWLLVLTISLTIFIFYRAYFMKGNSLESVLFNGTVVLGIICLMSLFRIAFTGYKFEQLQKRQEKLLTQQKFYMRCKKHTHNGVQSRPEKNRYPTMSVTETKIDESSCVNYDQDTGMVVLGGTENNLMVNDQSRDLSSPQIGSVRWKKDTDFGMRSRYRSDEDAMRVLMECRDKIETVNWYSHNVGFIEDIICIVRKKNIYPRLFGLHLNDVLAKAIAGICLFAIVTAFKLLID